jgi:hypothetical protein
MAWIVAVVAVLLAWALVAVWLEWRYPLGEHPVFKFNSPVPRLLRTGAVTVLGFCFVAGDRIGSHHRAHESYHHRCCVLRGRWSHLAEHLAGTLAGVWRHGLRRYTTATGRVYYAAYWWHPEEIAARAYADAVHHYYQPIGGAS